MLIKAKPRRPRPEPVPCEGCGARLVQSGTRCPGCRVRKCRGASFYGHACAVEGCGIDSPRVLRWHRFTDRTVALCANHSALAGRQPLAFAAFHALALEHDLQGWGKLSA
jgi:hypothetical protein